MILVTGGAGFIGSNLVGELARRGEQVSVCDTLGAGDKWRNLAKHDIDELVHPTELETFLGRRAGDIEYVFHLGAITSTTETDVDLIARTNVGLSQLLWRWCSQRHISLTYASSAATYGDGSAGFVDFEDPASLSTLRPLNAYGWSKHVFDRWVARRIARGRSRPPQWIGLKFFNVYGPNEYHKGPMRSLVAKAHPAAVCGEPVTLFRSHHPEYEDGGQMRDFVYVQDCVDVMLWIRSQTHLDGFYNVGSGKARSWLELTRSLYATTGHELEVDWVDTPREIRDRYQYFTEADLSKLRAAGYDRPFRTVEEGVSDYVESYLSTDDPYR